MPIEPLPTLDYAPRTSETRKRRRRAALLTLFIALALVTWRGATPITRRVQLLYWQRQCLNYTAPPDQIVYEDDPLVARALLARDPHFAPAKLYYYLGNRAIETRSAVHVPDSYKRLLALLPARVLAVPPSSLSVIFMHQLTSPRGHRRLVIVAYCATPSAGGDHPFYGHDYYAMAVTPASLFGTFPTRLSTGSNDRMGISYEPPNVRVYAGQLDPTDASRFNIDYTINGKTQTLHGWLNDEDRVTLSAERAR
jgi:hypothetical protein